MSRNAPAQAVTNLAAPHTVSFPLIEMQFTSGTTYACGLAFDVPWNGNTYLGVQSISAIEPIVETDTEVKGLAFSISGIPPAYVSRALSENVTKRPVIVRLATLERASGTLTVDPNVWQGYMDLQTLIDSAGSNTLRITAEHRMIAWKQPKLLRFTDEDQRRRAPTDGFFKHIASVSQKRIIWPGAEFFQR